jgi:hypothetical protein
VIWLAARWIRRFARNKVTYSIQYHADQDLDRLLRFWAFGLGVCEREIKLQRKSNSGQMAGRNWRSRCGVMSVTADDTRLRSRLQAWIDRVQEGWLDSPDGA